ncbi:MAG: TolC family protein, partial [Planctomycetes bacterium]|nr:TolC family protein [Planctomycetota bacterium]
RTLLPALASARAQAANRLALLLGEPPPDLHELDAGGRQVVVAGLDSAPLFSAVAVPDPVELLRPGLPSELLRRRPDIRRAERELAGATARVGVATADLYPRFSLTGSFGFEGLSTSGLFTTPNGIWSIGPTVRWPILASGRIAANIHAADAREEQALLRYRQTVLGAFADAENALVALLRERERERAFALAVAAHQNALALAKERQSGGVDDYQTVLREELALFTVQDDHQLSRLAVADDLVALAKALGGGWQVDEVEK